MGSDPKTGLHSFLKFLSSKWLASDRGVLNQIIHALRGRAGHKGPVAFKAPIRIRLVIQVASRGRVRVPERSCLWLKYCV